MDNRFLDAMNFRHACREFDPAKPVSEEALHYILEAGRLSPSSMGLEHWHFMVATGAALKHKLQAACNNQKQIGQSSVVVCILAKTADIQPNSAHFHKTLQGRFGANWESRLDYYLSLYKRIDPLEWSVAQCHIAAANMMTAAAFIGIDSCPIGGYDARKLMETLGADQARYVPALVIPFGYRAHEPKPRNRLPFEEVVTRLD